MEFLPLPQIPLRSLPDVPYLCGRDAEYPYQFDCLGWSNYPERMGWNKDDIYNDATLGGRRSGAEAASFLQAWLCFGLLFDFLGERYDQETFVAYTRGQRVVDFRGLQKRVSSWTRRVRSSSQVANNRLSTRLNGLSADAGVYIRRFCNKGIGFNSPLPDEVALSILLLASYLELAKVHVSQQLPNPKRIPTILPQSLESQMLQGNWCPSDITYLKGTLPLLATFYLSQIGPRRPQLQHSGCTSRNCTAYQIRAAQYQLRHTSACSCGDPIYVDKDEVSNIILRGETPLAVAQKPTLFGGMTLRTFAAQPTTKFVAISHVWSDGLGNPGENFLPRCQVQQLQQWCNHLLRPGFLDQATPFWMDTFCIPVNSRHEFVRRMAISRMVHVYSRAEKVLVIDQDLIATPLAVTDLELVAKIRSCGWLRRVWTLQEGVLAKSLYFQLQDGQVDLATLVKRLSFSESGDFNPAAQVAWELARSLVDLREMGGSQPTPLSKRIDLAISAVQFRSTTNSGDDVVCVDGILGFDATQVVVDSVTAPQRNDLQALLLKHRILPRDLLFFEGPKMSDVGWRWCSVDLTQQTGFRLDGDLTATLTRRGLLGQYHGIHISPKAKGLLKSGFMLYDQPNDLWLAVMDMSSATTADPRVQVPIVNMTYQPDSAPQPDNFIDSLPQPAIIFSRPPSRPDAGGGGGRDMSPIGVLVDVEAEIDTILHARYCQLVGLAFLNKQTKQMLTTMVDALGGSHEKLVGLSGMSVRMGRRSTGDGNGRMWCIS